MAIKPSAAQVKTETESELLERVKRLAVVAMFSDDELRDHLVLKGGNAMDLIHRLSTRASVDLDFSMQHDFPDAPDDFKARVERALLRIFQPENFEVFDVDLKVKPRVIPAEDPMSKFWGGYAIEFKLIKSDLFIKYSDDITNLRNYCLSIGQGKKFLIDISRFEYTSGKMEADLNGYTIFVYSPEMIVCEKLRAICQQMPEYGPIIKRARPGTARARDFFDICVLVEAARVDMSLPVNQSILIEMFKAKNVPIDFLGNIESQRDFHKNDFPAVAAAVKPGVDMRDYDYYFDYTLSIVKKLESLWHK